MVSFITEELVRRGHDVTLFASGDSRTCARLVPCCDEALRLSGKPEFAASLQLARRAGSVDSGVCRLVRSSTARRRYPQTT